MIGYHSGVVFKLKSMKFYKTKHVKSMGRVLHTYLNYVTILLKNLVSYNLIFLTID